MRSVKKTNDYSKNNLKRKIVIEKVTKGYLTFAGETGEMVVAKIVTILGEYLVKTNIHIDDDESVSSFLDFVFKKPYMADLKAHDNVTEIVAL